MTDARPLLPWCEAGIYLGTCQTHDRPHDACRDEMAEALRTAGEVLLAHHGELLRAEALPTEAEMAAALNDAQITPAEIQWGHDLTIPARRILAALKEARHG